MCNDSSYFTGKLFHVNGQSYFFNTIPGTINEIANNMAPILHDHLNPHGGCDIPRSGSYTGDLRPVIRNPYTTAEIKETLNHKLRLLVLELTTSCNMNCAYCINGTSYEQKDCFTSTQMSKQSAFDGVDYLINHSQNQSKPLAISFYGGEPLLRYSLLKEITIYAEKEASKKGKDIFFSITTNGTLLTGEMIEFFIQHSFQLVISLDGPAEINDRNRKLKNGEGTFNQIMNILQMIKKRDAVYFNHMVRCSVVVMPNADLIELATFFNELHVNLIVNFVETYGLDDARFRQKAPNNSMDTLQNSLIERLSKEGISILSNSSSGKDFSIALLSPMLRRFLEPQSSSRFMELGQCIPGASRLYLAADNYYYPCEKLAGHSIARIGNIETGIDPIKAENLIKQFYEMTSSKCSGCWMSSRCSACLALTCSGDGLDENKFNHYCNGIKSWGLSDLKMISKTMFQKCV
jgi:uncharacterized protein